MSRTNGIPYFQEFYCEACELWQLKREKGTRCRFCGANISINVEFRDPPTPEGMLKSEKAFAEAKNPYQDAINTLFCSHCHGIIVAEDDFCGGCGNPRDPTDIKPKAFIGKNEVPLEYLPSVQPGLEKTELSYPADLTQTSPSSVEDAYQEELDSLEKEKKSNTTYNYSFTHVMVLATLLVWLVLICIVIMSVVNSLNTR